MSGAKIQRRWFCGCWCPSGGYLGCRGWGLGAGGEALPQSSTQESGARPELGQLDTSPFPRASLPPNCPKKQHCLWPTERDVVEHPCTASSPLSPSLPAIHRPNTVSPRTQLRDPVETLSAPIRCPTAPATRRGPQPGAILLQTLPKTERNNMTVGNTFVHHQLLSTHFPLAREQAALC